MANAFDMLKDFGVDPCTVTKISSFSSTGDWTITGVKVGKPLYILGTADPDYINHSYMTLVAISGTDDAKMGANGDPTLTYLLSGGARYRSTNCLVVIPTETTVKFAVRERDGKFVANAYQ